MKLSLLDELLLHTFKKYSYKIYRIGVRDGFNWKNNTLQGCKKAVKYKKEKTNKKTQKTYK